MKKMHPKTEILFAVSALAVIVTAGGLFAVMMTDILLLDFFNTIGLPTSTTVSIVFELLGSAVAVALFKIVGSNGEFTSMSEFINTDSALLIIAGIFLSVIVAFAVGLIIVALVRFAFSFNLMKT